MYRTLLAGVVLSSVSCATPATAAKDTPDATNTPTAEELAELLKAPVEDNPSRPVERGTAATWTFAGPQPAQVGAVTMSPMNEAEQRIASAGFGSLTEAARCVARENGRFQHQEGAKPPLALEDYILRWCGAIATSAVIRRLPNLDGIEAGIAQEEDLGMGEGVELGVWVSEDGVIYLAALARLVALEPIPLVDPGALVTLRGRMLGEAATRFDAVRARTTSGPYETAGCNVDPTVRYPDFSIQCRRRDQLADISLYGSLVDSQLIALEVGAAAVFSQPPGPHYRSMPVPQVDSADDASFVPALLATVNQLRSTAGLRPVEYHDGQSKVLAAVRPRVDAALRAENYEHADRLIAGVRAGWEIDGDIIQSNWALRRFRRTDAADALAAMWMSAGTRRLLFEADARWVAVDWDEFGRLSWATYSELPEEHYNRRVGHVLRHINDLRSAYGKKPARKMGRINSEMKEVCDAVSRGELDAEAGYRKVGNLGYDNNVGRGWHYAYRTVSDLSDMAVSPDLLRRDDLEVGVGVAIARPLGEPFARYVVYFIWPQ